MAVKRGKRKNEGLYPFLRFTILVLVVGFLAYCDLNTPDESVNAFVYALLGAANGIDIYKYLKDKK